MPPGCLGTGQCWVGRMCHRADGEGGTGWRCRVARRDVMLVCWAHNCPWVELTQPQDKRYLEPAKPQHAAFFYFWVPQSPEMS